MLAFRQSRLRGGPGQPWVIRIHSPGKTDGPENTPVLGGLDPLHHPEKVPLKSSMFMRVPEALLDHTG
jgi:hypothetical protein